MSIHLLISAGIAILIAPAAFAQAADGAIFHARDGYAGLHEGTRARGVGDVLTILLVESTTTSKSVSGKTDKSGSLGLTPPATGPFAFLSPDALKASSSASFKGAGSAGQSSTLAASLAVTIVEVRPNGTALVQGEKQMLLSQGEEWVRFTGIVRLADIDIENTVPSSRVAEAHIEYSGKGAIQRSSRPGWLARFFSIINPF
ncbi:flagellar basal body L-ring protein FlgH [Croceicoccus mobilis]|uniref:Flagellar L-ring protein n=1 Tax=Croceicoccus mobilis TaxID=1703339 RepID=A0A917DRT1_9SPHN|nr:flagellar basal body L-ring protein FlgH [Croceicoccus mobilis]GGD63937.1 flagellar L-ring protein [Croceicoccus mobilis]